MTTLDGYSADEVSSLLGIYNSIMIGESPEERLKFWLDFYKDVPIDIDRTPSTTEGFVRLFERHYLNFLAKKSPLTQE